MGYFASAFIFSIEPTSALLVRIARAREQASVKESA